LRSALECAADEIDACIEGALIELAGKPAMGGEVGRHREA
jgi:hypothetical protein